MRPTQSNPPTVAPSRAAIPDEAARRGPGTPMTRTGWTTVAIPTELYDDIRKHHVPGRAKSVQAYVQFWVRVGSLIDRALAATPDKGDVTERVLQVLKNLSAAEKDP
ncbi:MAG TPA: hypothetical protein VM327_02945 [Candidatus Thermoplasmatota archaeon]|nr:hypothetical protein [Candidatus Thermoplasmatota archaeon]